ncbi:hypothetical protein, partial [Polaromonas hydrogenivorans]|uniref:hypothetical protein n=1 Tax=Polaromonas hydrogenivorans TaxID=335476 RepID=UPI0039F03CCE
PSSPIPAQLQPTAGAKRPVAGVGSSLAQWFEAQWLALPGRGERFNPRQEPGESFAAKRGKHKQSTQFNLLARLAPVQG